MTQLSSRTTQSLDVEESTIFGLLAFWGVEVNERMSCQPVPLLPTLRLTPFIWLLRIRLSAASSSFFLRSFSDVGCFDVFVAPLASNVRPLPLNSSTSLGIISLLEPSETGFLSTLCTPELPFFFSTPSLLFPSISVISPHPDGLPFPFPPPPPLATTPAFFPGFDFLSP